MAKKNFDLFEGHLVHKFTASNSSTTFNNLKVINNIFLTKLKYTRFFNFFKKKKVESVKEEKRVEQLQIIYITLAQKDYP